MRKISAPIIRNAISFATAVLLFCFAAGCKTSDPNIPLAEATLAMNSPSVRLNPGDTIQINFPSASQFNIQERIRLDGHISMTLVGDVLAAGKTPQELQADLRKLYANELNNPEVLVILNTSAASIFVAGAVGRPGRISLDRPMTVLDALMEAGGFDPRRANVKKVTVIRQKDGKYNRTFLNLKPVLRGENVIPFKVEPFDIIFVPEKIF